MTERTLGRALVGWTRDRGVLVAAGVAALLVPLVVFRAGLTPHALVGSLLVTVLAVLTVIDVRERRLPNRIVLPATGVVVALQLAFASERTLEWLVSGLCAALFFLVPLVVRRSAVGMGDVKLAFLLGVALGSDVVLALFVAAMAGAAAALVILVTGGVEARARYVPFGPFLALGAVAALLFQGG